MHFKMDFFFLHSSQNYTQMHMETTCYDFWLVNCIFNLTENCRVYSPDFLVVVFPHEG